jgi:hypothetical protein
MIVGVDADRIEVESPQSKGLTPTQAADIFRDVANRLGFVVDPVQDDRGMIQYTAHVPDRRQINNPYLTLWIDSKQVSFISDLYRADASENFFAAEDAASLYRQELDKRHIEYRVYKNHGSPFGP